MKNFTELSIAGCYGIEMFHAGDDRGMFVKPYHKGTMDKLGLVSGFQESFYSSNAKGVVRGMHFQFPPEDHAKIVYCIAGKLLDVILDLRTDSPTYGKVATIELSGSNYMAAYLPTGVAHGFCTLEVNTTMVYLTSTMYSAEYESGILWNSFNFDWPVANPIQSERDLTFTKFEDFDSPFKL